MPETGGNFPILDINQPAPVEPDKSVTGSDDQSVLQMVNDLFTRAKRGREPYLDRYGLDWYKFYRGEQWLDPLPDYLSTETVNYTFADIRSMLAIMTDSHPVISVVAGNQEDPADSMWAKLLREQIGFKWQKLNWGTQLAYCYLDKMLYRTGYWRIEWDKELNDGLGDVLVEAIDPFHAYPDPDAGDINNRNSKYFIYTEPVTIGQLKREYPDKAEQFRADIVAASGIREQRQEYGQQPVKTSSYEDPMVEARDYATKDSQLALKIHCWLRDETTEEYFLAKEQKTEQRKKWPNGRYIVIAGNQVCEDRPNPYEDGKFPFVRFANNPLPREFHGVSEVELRMSTQRMLNRLVSHWMNHIELQDNPIWVIPTNTGIDIDDITNEFGMVLEPAGDGGGIQRLGGVPMPAHIFNVYDRVLQSHNTVGGILESIRGRFESGITSGVMLNSLQEAAQAPIRLQERYARDSLSQAGQMIISRMFQFMNEPSVFQAEDKRDMQGGTFEMSVSQPNEQGVREARFRKLNSSDQQDMIGRSVLIKGTPEIKVTTGIGMPFAKAVQMDKAMQLATAGLIDREAALKMMDIENWEEIEQRMAEKEQAAAQAAAAEQGGPQ